MNGRRMKIEKSLVFIKPGNFEKIVEIFGRLDDLLINSFTKTLPLHIYSVPRKLIEEHYKHIRHIETYDVTINAFVNGDIIVCIYEGPDIVSRIRNAIGATDPVRADNGTIRKMFSNDSLEEAMEEKRYLNNVIHASENPKSAKKEIELWGKYYDLF